MPFTEVVFKEKHIKTNGWSTTHILEAVGPNTKSPN